VNDRRIDDTTGERKRFSSKILPPWCRKSPKISEVLPLLYLHGLSSGDFVPALEQFLGGTAGLSPATVTRLTKQWSEDHVAFQDRDLSDRDFVYVWADGVHPKVRLGQAHSCVLVLLGVRLDGTKELIALAEGLRESTESWADLLRDCRRRGMRDPELVIGDGAMGLWRALAEVFPAARPQRCWDHKTRNVTDCLPKSAQPAAPKAMQEIYNAEDRGHAGRRSRPSPAPTAPSGPRPSRRSPRTGRSCSRSRVAPRCGASRWAGSRGGTALPIWPKTWPLLPTQGKPAGKDCNTPASTAVIRIGSGTSPRSCAAGRRARDLWRLRLHGRGGGHRG
jgi:hypothetical protein